MTIVASTETDVGTSTVTVTGPTSTTDVEVYQPKLKRATQLGTTTSPGGTTVYASMVPTYASACSGTARYSSACSCWGISHSTTTVKASTKYVTVTAATLVRIYQPPASSVTATAATPVVTDDVTTTTSSEVTATATVGYTYMDDIECGQNISGPDDGFAISVICEAQPSSPGSVISSNVVGDWDACVKAGDDNYQCTSFEYTIATKTCTLYRDSTAAYSYQGAQGMVFAHFNNG